MAEHLESFAAFGGVRSYRRSATKETKLPAQHRSPLLMLPEKNEYSLHCSFYSFRTQGILRHINLALPPLIDRNERADKFGIRLLSSRGWLPSISNAGHDLLLHNPFSSDVIRLSTLSAYCNLRYGVYPYTCVETSFLKFVLSANPTTLDFVAALVVSKHYLNLSCYSEILSFWSNKDDKWITMEDLECNCGYDPMDACHDVNFYKGKFYAVDDSGRIVAFTINGAQDYSVKKVIPEDKIFIHLNSVDDGYPQKVVPYDLSQTSSAGSLVAHFYLVESEYQLLVVCRIGLIEENHLCTTSFRLFEVNVKRGDITIVQDLGHKSIFIGCNSSFAIEVSSGRGFKSNCVYLTDDHRVDSWSSLKKNGRDMGIYDLFDGTLERLNLGSHEL